MTSDRARPFIRLARAPARTAAIVIGLMSPHSLWAQDINAGDCAVNGKSEIEGCSSLDSAADAPVSTPKLMPKKSASSTGRPSGQCQRHCKTGNALAVGVAIWTPWSV